MIGAVLIVIGLYAVLWGKQKENEVTHCEILERPTKNIDPSSKVTEDVEANNGTEMKYSDSILSTIVISAPASETTLKKTIQEPWKDCMKRIIKDYFWSDICVYFVFFTFKFWPI